MITETGGLVARSWALQAKIAQRIADSIAEGGPQGGLRLFGEGIHVIQSRLPLLERATRSVVYNMQQRELFDPLRRERELNERKIQRKIAGHMMTTQSDHVSLTAACHPETWIAPVPMSGLVIDERLGLFHGPITVRGRPTAWLCDDPDIIDAFCDIWVETKRHATPIRDVPEVVPLTERQLAVVSLLSRGTKDSTISRLLGVSARTVTADVSRILDALHVSTRWEAGMILGRASQAL